VTKRIKRRSGALHWYKPENVHRKKVMSKDTKAKSREEKHLKLVNAFVIIGFDYCKIIPYEVPNKVGKMTTKVYTEVILPAVLGDLKERGLTLCQDADSAHDSKETKAWAKKNSLDLITLPSVSPDFSILESMAHPLSVLFTVNVVRLRRLVWHGLLEFLRRKWIKRQFGTCTNITVKDCTIVDVQRVK
jgi:hypothetical protein